MMADITYEKLMTTVVVILALIGAYLTIMSAVKTHREEVARKQAPTKTLEEKLADHDRMLDSDKRRIENLEKRTDDQDEQLKLILRGQLALIRHGVDGNNTQGLRDSQQDIQNYLIDKK